MSLHWICTCWSDPCGMWRFFIFRTILQPSINHLSDVSHRSDRAFKCVLKEEESSRKSVSQREIRGWSNEKLFFFLSYITISSFSLSVSVFRFLSLTDTLSLSHFLHPSRSPPRPSPGSLHYSDEDVSTKYNDLIPAESSSLTEKPSEISDSQVSSNPGFQPISTPCLE